MSEHLVAHAREQLIEKVLARIEVVVERALGNAGPPRDGRYHRSRIADFADHLRNSLEQCRADLALLLRARQLLRFPSLLTRLTRFRRSGFTVGTPD